MGMFSSDFWDEYYGTGGYSPKDSGWNRRTPQSSRGGHSEEWLERQMEAKNIETEGEYKAQIRGDSGELVLSSVMKSLPDCYHVLDDVLLQTKKGSTQLDHIIVSPFGIFIVETKNHKGMIFGDCYGQVWTQVLPGRGHFKMYSPVLQNMGHIKHLNSQTKIPLHYMQGVIVFTNNNANLSNVNCPFCFNVDSLYEYISSFQRICMSNKQVEEAIRRIEAVDTNSYTNRRKHVDYVKTIKIRRGY